MKAEKILDNIAKLQLLNDKNLNFLETAINSLLVAQSLEDAVNNKEDLRKIVDLIS